MTDAFKCECIDPGFQIALFDIIDHRVSDLGTSLEEIRGKLKRDPKNEHLQWMERTWSSMIKGALAIKEEFEGLPEC